MPEPENLPKTEPARSGIEHTTIQPATSVPLYRPASPFERRMRKFSLQHNFPPEGTPAAIHLQKMMDMDVAFQLKLKALKEKIPHLLHSRLKNGSGLQMSKLLRSYVFEFFNRYHQYGVDSFPTSFNVVESFMSFDRVNLFFELRHEREHLLSVNDYFRWYEKNEIPRHPPILESLMTEGVIYSYDMLSDENSLRISGKSQQVFAGVSFIRHEHELSCLLLAGENPPAKPDAEILKFDQEEIQNNRKGIEPDPNLSTKDRYLDVYTDFAKVILLTRFDLRAGKHDVRYVHLDLGQSFTVFTDDFSVMRHLPNPDKEGFKKNAMDGLARYDDLFAALSSFIYLPAFFAAFPMDVNDLRLVTELHAFREDKRVKETTRILGGVQWPKFRKVRCLSMAPQPEEASLKTIDPPPLEFKSSAYWKLIAPNEIGEDKDGEKILGRTWVSSHETRSARSPQSFILNAKIKLEPSGPDPGIIYVQRSPAHEYNVYKIGLTRRGAEVRAKELSRSSGVALPFGVLANWSVGDCGTVEKRVHERLAAYRVK